jgi:hypothetical protein
VGAFTWNCEIQLRRAGLVGVVVEGGGVFPVTEDGVGGEANVGLKTLMFRKTLLPRR